MPKQPLTFPGPYLYNFTTHTWHAVKWKPVKKLEGAREQAVPQ